MSGIRECKLGDVISFGNGKSRPSTEGNNPIYGGNGILGYCGETNYSGETIIIGRVGAYCGSTYYENRPVWVSDNALSAKPKEKNDAKYFYYFLKNMDLNQLAQGSSHPLITQTLLNSIDVEIVADPDEQRAIASVLSSLDDKIDLLHRQNKTLEAMAETLFRQWFVEEASEDWEEKSLGDFFPVVTGKKDANYSSDNGLYPFFTCSRSTLKADNFSFDGAAILLAGNGDFNVKRYIGKFEAYQRTYVLIPYDDKMLGFLYTLMKYFLNEITEGHQGSVINFITKGMISDFKFYFPRRSLREELLQFNTIYDKIDSNDAAVANLTKIRNQLLPKLMGGEVRVSV